MPRRLFLALLLLVAAPMVLLGWMSANAVRANQTAAKENLAFLLSTQLSDLDDGITQLFSDYQTQLDRELASADSVTSTLRRIRRELPIVRQGIIVDSDGVVLFPSAADNIGIDAAEVAAALPGLIDGRPRGGIESDGVQKSSQKAALAPYSTQATASESSWQQWYMADGTQIVYWRGYSDGLMIGVLLERSRWIADLIATLPDQRLPKQAATSQRPVIVHSSIAGGKLRTSDRNPTPIGSIALTDEANRIIYRWGDVNEFRFPVLVSKPLSPPLASWQLRLHVDQSLLPITSAVPMFASLGGIAIVLLAVGFYVLTSVQRQISDARSRVSFAGQVSHELRTPLTNIRLYTELAQSDLDRMGSGDPCQPLAQRLAVIDHESRRLQRLVSGVLEMIRPSGKKIAVRLEPCHVGELIAGITRQFEPSFSAAKIRVESRCDCDVVAMLDPDIVEMVLVNLLSNVERYVTGGGTCSIECRFLPSGDSTATRLRVLVDDDGPGIPAKYREKVFRPFERLDDSINAPSGTGIGLTIARRAIQRHGGQLNLLSHSPLGGAAFEMIIPVVLVAEDRVAEDRVADELVADELVADEPN